MPLNPPANPSVFSDRSQVTAALQRAADRARIIAEQTGTQLIVVAPPQTPNPPDKRKNTASSTPHDDGNR